MTCAAPTDTGRTAWLRRGKPMNNVELADNLCALSSALREARRVHEKSFGTLIPHVFMNDVLARVGSCLRGGAGIADREQRTEIAGILDSLEHGMQAGDRETRNVIAISFVGDGELEPFFEALSSRLGPRVGAQRRAKQG